MALRRNMDTAESRAYWRFVEETAAEVATWPAWKRGVEKMSNDNETNPMLRKSLFPDEHASEQEAIRKAKEDAQQRVLDKEVAGLQWQEAVQRADDAFERNRLLEKALCAAREHDPSCPVKPIGPYDPLVHVDGCDCGAAKTNARIDAALSAT